MAPFSLAAVVITEATVTTWGLMAALVLLALFVRRQVGTAGLGPLENLFEMVMDALRSLIREIVHSDPDPYVPLVATLFIFVFVSNLVGTIPGLASPTGDIGVTAGLAAVVFLSVPFYGIRARGTRAFMGSYLKPNAIMLPFNLLGELTRTLALAVRLFGNIMSGNFLFLIIVGVVTTLLKGYAVVFIPFAFALTLFVSVLGLITAVIQAYIFTVLALVYIGAAVESRSARPPSEEHAKEGAN